MHEPQSVTHLRNKFSPRRPFCRCKAQLACIPVAVARRKSLSVPGVIVVIDIALMGVLPTPDQPHLGGPVKSINPHAPGASIMPPGKSVTENAKSK